MASKMVTRSGWQRASLDERGWPVRALYAPATDATMIVNARRGIRVEKEVRVVCCGGGERENEDSWPIACVCILVLASCAPIGPCLTASVAPQCNSYQLPRLHMTLHCDLFLCSCACVQLKIRALLGSLSRTFDPISRHARRSCVVARTKLCLSRAVS